MIVLALAGRAIGELWRRAILAFEQLAPRSNRDVPPEFCRFPIF